MTLAPVLNIARAPQPASFGEIGEEGNFFEFDDSVDIGDFLYNDGVDSGKLVFA